MAFLNETKNHDEISDAKYFSFCITIVNISTLNIWKQILATLIILVLDNA